MTKNISTPVHEIIHSAGGEVEAIDETKNPMADRHRVLGFVNADCGASRRLRQGQKLAVNPSGSGRGRDPKPVVAVGGNRSGDDHDRGAGGQNSIDHAACGGCLAEVERVGVDDEGISNGDRRGGLGIDERGRGASSESNRGDDGESDGGTNHVLLGELATHVSKAADRLGGSWISSVQGGPSRSGEFWTTNAAKATPSVQLCLQLCPCNLGRLFQPPENLLWDYLSVRAGRTAL